MNENEFIINLEQLGLKLSDKQLLQFNRYYELLVEWNQKMNLTGITEKDEVYLKHFYDSATLVKIIDFNKYETFCDVGTGAGFPGIVIKILFPHLKVTLIDSLNKRLLFLNKVIEELNLTNIETIHSRIEDYGKNNRNLYDIVSARAVAQLNVLLELCLPIVKIKGFFIPMKGNISQEILNIKNTLKVLNSTLEETIEFTLPYEESNRTILRFRKDKDIDKKYPRNIKVIKANN